MKKIFICMAVFFLAGCADGADPVVTDGGFSNPSAEQSTEPEAIEPNGPDITDTPGRPVREPVPWQEVIESRMSGSIREHMQVEYGGRFYDLLVAYLPEPRWPGELQTRVFVSEKRDGEHFLLQSIDVIGRRTSAEGGLVITDLNFDGHPDIMVRQEQSGSFGSVHYSIFIYGNGAYQPPHRGFSSISNPIIDAENEWIITTWRNLGGVHGARLYVYANGAFEMADNFSRRPVVWGEGENPPVIMWQYSTSHYYDGEWITEVFYTGDARADEIFEKFGYAARGPAPTLPPPLTLEQIQVIVTAQYGSWVSPVIAAERIPFEEDYIYHQTAQEYFSLRNAALYRVTFGIRETYEDFLYRTELSPGIAEWQTRDGDYTTYIGYYHIHEINGVPELVVTFC